MSELPSAWEKVPIASITEDASQRVPSADEQITYIDIGSLDRNSKTIVAPQRLLGADAPSRARKQVRSGDTLVSMTRPNLNAVALVPPALDGQIASTGFDVLRPLAGIDERWIAYLVRTEAFVHAMSSAVQGALYPAVRSKDVRAYRVPLAPSAEQTRIADQLDTLLVRVQACNDRIDAIPALLKRFRQVVLESALYGGLLDDSKSSGEREISVPIASLATVGTGSTPLRSNGQFFASSGTPWVTSASTSHSLITHASEFVTQQAIDAHRLRLYPKGTLLVAMYGEGRTRGQVAELGIEATINQACAAVVVDEAKALTAYVKLALQVNYLSMRELAEGGNQPNLNLSKVKGFQIPLPSLERQKQIVQEANKFLGIADRIEARHAAARTQAQRLTPLLLAKAFRGELVQQDPQDEPASVLLQRMAALLPVKPPTSRGRPRAQPKAPPAAPELKPTDWTALPNGAWAAPADPDGQAAAVWLTAVLRAWGEPMPERAARLAILLCQQPRLFTAVLPTAQAKQWSRLVGDEARPLPAKVSPVQPATDSHWGRAIKGMKARGDLVEAGHGDGITWALGPGAASIETMGWPDGRAGFVVAHLRAHGIASVLPSLEPVVQAFVDVRAA